jgi:hypothetical protein
MFQRFLDAADYWFGCSDDSSTGSHDPAHECFVVVVNDQADGTNVTGAGNGEGPQNPGTVVPRNSGPSAPPPRRREVPTSMRTWPKRASSRLRSKEYRAVRLLRASIAREASARGKHVRELGKHARERINADFNVDDPNTPPHTSQKLITAATLLQAMPAPSTPEARNLHREAQALIEQEAV